MAQHEACGIPILHVEGTITAQHSTAQHSTAQHSTAQHSTAQHRAFWADQLSFWIPASDALEGIAGCICGAYLAGAEADLLTSQRTPKEAISCQVQ